jgi:hypothetical protein
LHARTFVLFLRFLEDIFDDVFARADWPLRQCGNCREALFWECDAFFRMRGILKIFVENL